MTKEERAEICRQNGRKSKKFNEYKIIGDTVYVKLTNTGNTMICDADIWEQAKKYAWHENNREHYAETTNGKTGKKKKFHHLILPYKEGFVTDHINRNRLDNRRINLRYATHRANNLNKCMVKNNTSGVTGIYRKPNGKWQAVIFEYNRHISLGYYWNKEDAIKARKEAEEKYYKTIIENETC